MSVATRRVSSVWFTKKYECKPHNMKYVAIVTVHLYKVASDYQPMQTTWENHCWRSRAHCKSFSCQDIRNTKFLSQETSQQIWDWNCSQQQLLWIISVTNTTYNIPECGFLWLFIPVYQQNRRFCHYMEIHGSEKTRILANFTQWNLYLFDDFTS